MTEIAPFVEYLDASTSHLNSCLKRIIQNGPVQYDFIYEQFLKSVEQFKISLFSELKSLLLPGYNDTECSKEIGVLQQMKIILTMKIKEYNNFSNLMN
jgi:hypothetical protein